nr:hypothetical protein [Leuven Partiti-like virus 3]
MEPLPSKKGFQIDTRHHGLDRDACMFANAAFGRHQVDHAISTLHRSVASHEEIKADILSYDRKYINSKVRQTDNYRMVLQSVRDDFLSQEKLIPLTLGGAWEHPEFPKDKSPGLPWTERGFKTKGAVLDDTSARNEILGRWDAIGRGRDTGLPDTAAFFRAQVVTKDKNKIRGVWGVPLDVISEEARFFLPYIKFLKQSNAPIAYRLEMATGGMAYIDDMIRHHRGKPMMMTDIKEFDKAVPPWLIRDAFNIIFDSMDFEHVIGSDGNIWNVNSDRTRRRINRLIKYFINTPVRLPSGERYRKSGGVPSGSMFTNIIDTIVNVILTRFSVYETTGHLPLGEMYLGDDSFVICDGVLNLSAVAEVAQENFGMTVHPDKSYVTDNPMNVQFLGYYNRRGLPYKGHAFLIASFIYPERYVKTPLIRTSRAIGQMWSTMHSGMAAPWHRLVQHMLKYYGIEPGDVYDFITTHPGQFRYLTMLGITPEQLTLPERICELVPAIDPPCYPLRDYVYVAKDTADIFSRSVDL